MIWENAPFFAPDYEKLHCLPKNIVTGGSLYNQPSPGSSIYSFLSNFPPRRVDISRHDVCLAFAQAAALWQDSPQVSCRTASRGKTQANLL